MVTLHEVITFLVSMQISISSLQTHNVNRCGRSRSEERFSRNAETDLVCRLLLEKKKEVDHPRHPPRSTPTAPHRGLHRVPLCQCRASRSLRHTPRDHTF